MRKLFIMLLVIFVVVSTMLTACETTSNYDDDYLSEDTEEYDDYSSYEDIPTDESSSVIVFDILQFNNISSQKLIDIMGEPDAITKTEYLGFVEIPYTVYDYNHDSLGAIQFDVINDKVAAFTINGELPYNGGNVLDTLNVTIENENNISSGDLYIKYECPTKNIDLIHAALIDSEADTYKSLSIQYDSCYYREWNLPIFYGAVSPGEYRVLVEEFIKSMCNSPKSADFPTFDWEYARNNYYFCVESYVDVKNAFGVEIRHYFSVIYYNDTQAIVYALLDGEVIIDNGYVPTADIIKSLVEESTTDSKISDDIISDECMLYTEVDLPIVLRDSSHEVSIQNIEYAFGNIDTAKNTCVLSVSFDLISDYYVENLCFNFSLIENATSKKYNYSLTGINVYGNEGNYISISSDYYSDVLPIDDYTIIIDTNATMVVATSTEPPKTETTTSYVEPVCTHNYGAWNTEISASCESTGVVGYYTCKSCGKYFNESYQEIWNLTIPVSGHSYSTWIPEKAQTCSAEGAIGHYNCNVCGKNFDANYNVVNDLIIEKSHNYVNGVCSYCNTFYYSDGLKYTRSDDRTYYVVSGIGECTDNNVFVPSTYNGLPVTQIDRQALDMCDTIQSITLPYGITHIGYHSFGICKNMVSVTLPNSVLHIDEQAFSNCGKLESIIIPDSVTSLGSRVFLGCGNLTTAVLGNGVTTISSELFRSCGKLKSITIPKTVTAIGDYAFYDCENLTSITFGGTKGEWNNIKKGANWDSYAGDYVVHCSDGDC